MKRLLFWDWAGTLADESKMDEAVCQSIEEEIAEKENISLSAAQLKFKKHLENLENTWQWHDYILHGESFGIDWEAPQKRNLGKLILLPHAEEILTMAKEKGWKNILATNAVRKVILLRIDHANLHALFKAIIASDDVHALKSEGKHFEKGLKNLNGSPQHSFSIGNNPVQDIIPAKKLNLRTVLCKFGSELTHYHSEHISNDYYESVKSDFSVGDLSEIKDIL